MTTTALLKFDQGPNTATGGQALVGSVEAGPVTVSNTSNTDVARWIYTLLYVPPGSALTTGVKLDSTVTNFYNFTPDIHGCYRWKLEVRNALNTVVDVDIRNFAIREPRHGYIIPPYQKDPDPLPTLASGEASAKPNELNFYGLELGWAGDDDANMLHQVVRDLDASNYDLFPRISGLADKSAVVEQDDAFNFPTTAVSDGLYVWVINQNTLLGGSAGFAKLLVPDARSPMLTAPLAISTAVLYDGVRAGSNVWACGQNTAATDGLIAKLVPGTATVTHTTVTGTTSFNSIAYDGTYLWVGDAAAGGGLYRIDPNSPAGPYTTLLSGDNIWAVKYDAINAYGDSNPRILATDRTSNTLKRSTVSGSPSIDATFSHGSLTSPRYVDAGGGFVWMTGLHTGVPRIWKINPSAFTLASSATLGPIDVEAYGVRYAAGKVWVVGSYDTGGGGERGVLVSINPTSLAIVDTIYLGGSVSADAALRYLDGYLWVAHLSFGGSVLSKVDPAIPEIVENLNLRVGFGRPVAGHVEIDLLTSPENTSLLGYETIGGRYFDPNDYLLREGDDVTWDVIIETSNVLNSADIRLYNVTDSVSVATLTTSSLTPTHLTAVLNVGTDLPIASKWYELQMKMGAGSSPDAVTCRTSKLVIDQ